MLMKGSWWKSFNTIPYNYNELKNNWKKVDKQICGVTEVETVGVKDNGFLFLYLSLQLDAFLLDQDTKSLEFSTFYVPHH